MDSNVRRVAVSLAGKDKNHLLAVVSDKGNYAFVCDGKMRPLANPKRKNIKHLAFTQFVLSQADTVSDPALRKALLRTKELMPKESEV